MRDVSPTFVDRFREVFAVAGMQQLDRPSRSIELGLHGRQQGEGVPIRRCYTQRKVVRARFRLIVTIRPKYAYKEPAAILQAPAPEHIVEAGLPTEALLAQVAVSKYADGLPLYRQESIYGRDGVELGVR